MKNGPETGIQGALDYGEEFKFTRDEAKPKPRFPREENLVGIDYDTKEIVPNFTTADRETEKSRRRDFIEATGVEMREKYKRITGQDWPERQS